MQNETFKNRTLRNSLQNHTLRKYFLRVKRPKDSSGALWKELSSKPMFFKFQICFWGIQTFLPEIKKMCVHFDSNLLKNEYRHILESSELIYCVFVFKVSLGCNSTILTISRQWDINKDRLNLSISSKHG